MTFVDTPRMADFLRSLEKRFLAFLKTICAKHMKRLFAWAKLLRRSGENSRSHFGQLIALALTFPCFTLGKLAFKAAVFFHKLQLLRLRRNESV